MNSSTEKKPVDPAKSDINSAKPESSEIEKKNALVAPKSEPVAQGNKQ